MPINSFQGAVKVGTLCDIDIFKTFCYDCRHILLIDINESHLRDLSFNNTYDECLSYQAINTDIFSDKISL